MERALSSEALTFAINHVFLPPKLPQEDDQNSKHELSLLSLIGDALNSFEKIVNDSEKGIVQSLQRTFDNAKAVFVNSRSGESVQEDKVKNILAHLHENGTALPLHIKAQNAGVIITRTNDRFLFEVFELSPHNEAVMTTKGRLRRQFPGTAVLLDADIFSQTTFQQTVAQTLVKMSQQRAPDVTPKIAKAGQMHEEDRDTTHPRLVTELFAGFLRANGTIETIHQIQKNTREEVLWSSCLSPWRRSPFWLLIRVTLQLTITRYTNSHLAHQCLYKRFMAFFMSTLLDKACELSLPPDILHVMNAKIVRRVLKLKMDPNTIEFEQIRHAVQQSSHMLKTTWDKWMTPTVYRDYRSDLKRLDFVHDLDHRLPDLDQYLASIATWPSHAFSKDFRPSEELLSYPASKLPESLDTSPHNLAAFEAWVASNLSSWLQTHRKEDVACASIYKLLLEYHAATQNTYDQNPEATSRMILITLELWVACDISARESCSLLDDYDPGFPVELLQCLLLPTRSMMERLYKIEKYLANRRTRARFMPGSIFVDFGTPDCFAVRYFNNSTQHQELLSQINARAVLERGEKKVEYERLKAEYQDLMRSYDESDCDYEYYTDTWYSGPQQRHSRSCKHCQYLSSAQSLTIDIHEWPLPDEVRKSQNVVFELMVPSFFGFWRNACQFVIHQIFQSRYGSKRSFATGYSLETYQGLDRWFRPFDLRQDIFLLSEVKPHGATHRRNKMIGHTSLDEVCLNNALRYNYFDSRQSSFVGRLETTGEMQRACTYTIPARSSGLQQYIVRPYETPSGPDPNTVLAQQTDCPQHLSLLEYKALATLPLGFRLVWLNILQQLSMPTVDFKKEETMTVILQCIHQTGPSDQSNILRATHTRLNDRSFSLAVLKGLNEVAETIRSNWESVFALSTLISVASRLLTLTSDEDIMAACLSFLSLMRITALKWLSVLQDKRAHESNAAVRRELHLNAAKIALICTQTFFLDERHVKNVVRLGNNASSFLECCIAIHDSESLISQDTGSLTKRLHQQWKEFCYHIYPTLRCIITEEANACLDKALVKVWQAYEPYGRWQSCTGPASSWLMTNWTNESDKTEFKVHYNLLSGSLLVNGLPLNRLPKAYERHKMYQVLFGDAIFEVMPSQCRGMQFAAKRPYAECALDFGIQADVLRIRATTQGKCYMLVPSSLFHGLLPSAFINDYVHWYNMNDDSLEFRPVASPWASAMNGWVLSRSSTGWQLIKNGSTLVNINSKSAKVLSSLVSSLADRQCIHITYMSSTSCLEIGIPRLQLKFFLTPKDDRVQSKQFRGFYIDADQSLDTLVGLEAKLLLKHLDGSRMLMLPRGSVSVRKLQDHVRVSVDQNSVQRFYVYRIDSVLGRLVDNGTLQSKLYLCYLHALTSFCLPDQLTHQTGTEQALSILRSSAVLSYDVLSQEDTELLTRIASLTPLRVYYPAHACVMQKVEWNDKISSLSQHGHFYKCVANIFQVVTRAKTFMSGTGSCLPSLPNMESTLLSRDDIRSSCWRNAGSGMDDHTTAHDQSYSARDQRQLFTTAQNVFIASTLVRSSQPALHSIPGQGVLGALWKCLATCGTVNGPLLADSTMQLGYDSVWLTNPGTFLRERWCDLQRYLHEHQNNNFSIAMWLSTISFVEEIDFDIVQILILFLKDPRMRQLQPPSVHRFDLTKGFTIDRCSMQKAIGIASLPLSQSPERLLARQHSESVQNFKKRQQRQLQTSRNRLISSLIDELQAQWPCEEPSVLDKSKYNSYLDVDKALGAVKPLLHAWYDNHRFRCYSEQVIKLLHSTPVQEIALTHNSTYNLVPSGAQGYAYVDVPDLFDTTTVPSTRLEPPKIKSTISTHTTRHSGALLAQVIDKTAASSRTRFEHKYVEELRESLQHLQTRHVDDYRLDSAGDHGFQIYYENCVAYVEEVFASICSQLVPQRGLKSIAVAANRHPQPHPILLLQQLHRLRWTRLPVAWKRTIVEYGKAISMLQRAERIRLLQNSPTELCKEVMNSGHDNWDPLEHPESLLLEVEQGFLIRPVQEEVAKEMRRPSGTPNAVMQLNMGEGKSSVIVPMVAASLSDGSKLVRVVVAKPQSKQMFHTLVTKLGGLLARRIYRLPFSRDLKLNNHTLAVIREVCEECTNQGGVLMLQPEHILSMQLAGLDCHISDDAVAGRSMLSLQKYFDTMSRDIVDESDENFSVKFELIYTVGTQQSVEMGPTRWSLVHKVLDLVENFAVTAATSFPDAIEISNEKQGIFPKLRVLRTEAWCLISRKVAEFICEFGLVGLPVARLPNATREAIYKFILESDVDDQVIAAVHGQRQQQLWTDTFQAGLLLLRGLLAGGVLLFAFSQKRWRVNYGLTDTRQPPTQLAVPYRAKDDPALRAEFSHPDVVIVLTCLSHYYSGLSDEDLYLILSRVLKSDQGELEYQEWIKDCPNLPTDLRHVCSVNLKDSVQCTQRLFPVLRKRKKVIDYFLGEIIFPRQLKTFPHKLSASGWDMGKIKTNPTTGFSGTNDSRTLLPLDVSYLNLPNQKYTNALVLEHLLQPETSVLLMPSGKVSDSSEMLLSMIVNLEPPVRVLLDAGAQILELSNVEVAQRWLQLTAGSSCTEAVVFFGIDDELNVIDRQGHVELLQTSFFAEQLDLCLVFLDEAHTRGTDLKLPPTYRAAVTLGPKVTKDKLTQACMRMRKLGNGQSVVFCVPHEIQGEIQTLSKDVTPSSIVRWAIAETCNDIQTAISLWAVQGQRFVRQSKLWQDLMSGSENNSQRLANMFLEDESRSLDQLYRPNSTRHSVQAETPNKSNDPRLATIQTVCAGFGYRSTLSTALYEEQERELSPEIEREREVQRPARAEAAPHQLHPDLVRYVVGGELASASTAWRPAFRSLGCTVAGGLLNLAQFPAGLLVTADFARTIRTERSGDKLDDYQRSVQWVLRSVAREGARSRHEQLMIISPYEAQEILPRLAQSDTVTLHLYAPRTSFGYRPLDHLELHCIGKHRSAQPIPQSLKVLLNLFAGQLYFQTFEEHRQVCEFLGLAWTKTMDGDVVDADGFILSSTKRNTTSSFSQSPVPFLRSLMAGIRRNGETIDKTHMGIVLDGGLLRQDDFA